MCCLYRTVNKRNAFAYIKSDFVFAYKVRFMCTNEMHFVCTGYYTYVYICTRVVYTLRVCVCVCVCVRAREYCNIVKKFVICIHCRFNCINCMHNIESYKSLLYYNWQDVVCYYFDYTVAVYELCFLSMSVEAQHIYV